MLRKSWKDQIEINNKYKGQIASAQINSQKANVFYEKISFSETTNFPISLINLVEKPHRNFIINLDFFRISISHRKANLIQFPLFKQDHPEFFF